MTADTPADPDRSVDHDAVTVSLVGGQTLRLTHRRVFSWIYGLVICSAVLAAGADLPTTWEVALYVASSMVVYWGAECYAHVMASRTITGETIGWTQIRVVLAEGWMLVTASFLPTGVLLVTGFASGGSVGLAVDLAMGTCVVLLFIAGWTAATHSGVQGRWHLIAAASVSAAFGLAMAALKLAVH